jgi:hypothetical protein
MLHVSFSTGENSSVQDTFGNICWPDGFDLENLESNTIYEINIYRNSGVVAKWKD